MRRQRTDWPDTLPISTVRPEFPGGTHEDQGGAQIFVVFFFQEFLVAFLSRFPAVLIELSLTILLGGWHILFSAVRGSK